MNMVGFNAGNPALGTMPMANNVPNGVTGRAGTNGEENNLEAKLNSYIYSYFLNKGQWDIARTLKNSGIPFEPPILHTDGDVNGADDSMQTDSKDGIIDTKRPDDLPDIHKQDVQSGSFLLNWFGLFWDIYWAQQKQPSRTSTNAMTYVQQTQVGCLNDSAPALANAHRSSMLECARNTRIKCYETCPGWRRALLIITM